MVETLHNQPVLCRRRMLNQTRSRQRRQIVTTMKQIARRMQLLIMGRFQKPHLGNSRRRHGRPHSLPSSH